MPSSSLQEHIVQPILNETDDHGATEQAKIASTPPKKKYRSNANLVRRWRTLAKVGKTLHKQYGARVYFSISVPQNHKNFVYRSGIDVSPLLEHQFV